MSYNYSLMDEINPIISLALNISSNKGGYALLIGSGVSKTSKMPTGWDVLCQLINDISIFYNKKPVDNPIEWYQKIFHEMPDYSSILNKLTKTPVERSLLLSSFFEPSQYETRQGYKLPSKAHKEIAKLISNGYINVIITTNFDRLIEKSLFDKNINAKIINTPDGAENSSILLNLKKPLVVKINGDYMDLITKNTKQELSSYDSRISNLLSQIFKSMGLIVVGWSSLYDIALAEALKKNTCSSFPTYWIDPYELNDNAKNILSTRNGSHIKDNADNFFACLTNLIGLNKLNNDSFKIPKIYTKFIGREDDIRSCSNLLFDNRLVSITGFGGIGKTRLAIAVLELNKSSFSDGCYFIDLSQCNDNHSILKQIVKYLNITESTEIPLIESIFQSIANKELFMVFDNCEQIIVPIANIINTLLDNCPKIKIFTTTRKPLKLPYETIYNLGPMNYPSETEKTILNFDSVKLFYDRAKSKLNSFTINESNSKFIASICKKLDGIPLAIELAASRIVALSVDQIDSKLAEKFKLLSDSSINTNYRQQSLRNTIDWSYGLLGYKERMLLQRMSVFSGSYSLDAIENICHEDDTDATEMLDLLSELIENSFIIKKTTFGSEARYRILEPIKEYALEKLGSNIKEYKQKHMLYFQSYMNGLEKITKSKETIIACQAIEKDYDNIMAALEFAYQTNNKSIGLNLIYNMRFYCANKGFIKSQFENYKRFINLDSQIDDKILVDCLNDYAGLTTIFLDMEESIRYLSQSYKKAYDIKYYDGMAFCLYSISSYHFVSQNTRDIALNILYKAKVAALKEPNDTTMARILYAIGRKKHQNGESYLVLTDACDKAIKYVENKYPHVEAYIYANTGQNLLQSNNDLSIKYLTKALSITEKYQLNRLKIFCYECLGDYYISKGKPEKAKQYMLEVLESYKNNGMISQIIYSMLSLANLFIQEDHYKAMSYMKEAIKLSIKEEITEEFVDSVKNYIDILIKTNNIQRHYALDKPMQLATI